MPNKTYFNQFNYLFNKGLYAILRLSFKIIDGIGALLEIYEEIASRLMTGRNQVIRKFFGIEFSPIIGTWIGFRFIQ